MNIGVCVKSTPDTDTRIKIAPDAQGIDPAGIKWIISPYDAFALEEGVKSKAALGGEVILFTVGDDTVQKNLRDGLAVGGDRAVQIHDPALGSADSRAVALSLATALEAEGVKLVFCGKQAIDDDNAQVPAMVAESLGWPQVTNVTAFQVQGTEFSATRAVGNGIEEVVKGTLPVVISADRGLNTPRYAKLPDIMKAKKKAIDKKDLGALGLSADDVAPAIEVTAYTLPPERPKGRILQGERESVVKELVNLLRNEAKVL